MKYFQTKYGVFIIGDNINTLRSYPEDTFDLIITDPPYNVLDKIVVWDRYDPAKYLPEIHKVLSIASNKSKKDLTLYMFFSQKYMFEWYKKFNNIKSSIGNLSYKRLLIWWHSNLQKPTNNSYLWSYDPIFMYTRGKPYFKAEFSKSTNADVIKEAIPQSNFKKDKKFHTAQKPLKVIEHLITNSSRENELVVDPFAGSGTVGVVAERLKRRWICIDNNEESFKIAKQKFDYFKIDYELWS